MLYEKVFDSVEDIRVISDPFRLKILVCFDDDEVPLTVKQLSKQLGEVASRVHYHVKELERIGALEIVETREKSGIIEKYYLPTAKNFKISRNIGTASAAKEDCGALIKNMFESVSTRFDAYMQQACCGNAEMPRALHGLVYLTDEDAVELYNLVSDFVNSKARREGAKPYWHTMLLFRNIVGEGGEADE